MRVAGVPKWITNARYRLRKFTGTAAALLERAIEILGENNALLACAQTSNALDALHAMLRDSAIVSIPEAGQA